MKKTHLLAAVAALSAASANAVVVDTADIATEVADVTTNAGAIFAEIVPVMLGVVGLTLAFKLIKRMTSRAV